MSRFILVSCEGECSDTTQAEQALVGQFGASPSMVRLRTLAGVVMRLRDVEGALFVGKGEGLPVLLIVDDETGEKIWAGERPSELEILHAVYLAGNFM